MFTMEALQGHLRREVASLVDADGISRRLDSGRPLTPEEIQKLIDLLDWVEVYLAVSYFIAFGLFFGVYIYLRINRNAALSGSNKSARKVILPAFEPFMLVLAAISFLFGAYATITRATTLIDDLYRIFGVEIFLTGRQIILIAPTMLMTQKSISKMSIARAMLFTLAFAALFFTLQVTTSQSTYLVNMLANLAGRFVLNIWWLFIFFRPPQRASKRTLRENAVFSQVYIIIEYLYNILFYFYEIDAGRIVAMMGAILYTFCVIPIWRLLRADTEHWRGLGKRSAELQGLLRQKMEANEVVSANGLHVLIELHRKYIIDFAFLKIKDRIGEGSTAQIFNGTLNNKTDVAVKVYTPREIKEEEVAAFSNEAALCSAIQHPNIVQFYGICVCPPNICLLSELCVTDLAHYLESVRVNEPKRKMSRNLQLCHILDASRAVAYLHSFTPPFVHRDIKTSNFLIDERGVAKLSDFGESRYLPDPDRIDSLKVGSAVEDKSWWGRLKRWWSGEQKTKSTGHEDVDNEGKELKSLDPLPGVTLKQNDVESGGRMQATMTVKGTVDYMAPELMEGKAGNATYGEAADIFSLSMTIWDILHPGKEKYPGLRGHLHIYDLVLEGNRPEIDASVHPRLRQLMEMGWDPNPSARPRAIDMVEALEEVQEELCFDLIERLQEGVDLRTRKAAGKSYANSFSAAEAIDFLLESGSVSNAAEAVRLGNALMDAGFVHHIHHERPFDNVDQCYMFTDGLDEHAARGLGSPTSTSGTSTITLSDIASEDGGSVGGKSLSSSSLGSSCSSSVGGGGSSRRRRANSHSSSISYLSTNAETGLPALCSCQKFAVGLKKAKLTHIGGMLRGAREKKERRRSSINVEGLRKSLLPLGESGLKEGEAEDVFDSYADFARGPIREEEEQVFDPSMFSLGGVRLGGSIKEDETEDGEGSEMALGA